VKLRLVGPSFLHTHTTKRIMDGLNLAFSPYPTISIKMDRGDMCRYRQDTRVHNFTSLAQQHWQRPQCNTGFVIATKLVMEAWMINISPRRWLQRLHKSQQEHHMKTSESGHPHTVRHSKHMTTTRIGTQHTNTVVYTAAFQYRYLYVLIR
jgi:hypothetical protein